jgi:cytochrome c5
MRQWWGGQLPQGTDPSLLPDPGSTGARLLVEYCSQCHGVPAPGLHTAAEWPQVLGRMEMRMRSTGGGMMGGGMMGRGMMGIALPTGAEWDTLLAYLQRYAQQPIETGRYPDLNTPAGEALRTFCTQCHALPDPRQHTAKDWPAVVARMRSYMGPMGKMVPGETATKEIIDFLQRHGAAGK